MPAIGDPAPAFTVVDDAGAEVTLAGLLEGGPFVLYFYPADFTPVCTRQACMFRDIHPEMVAAGVRVVGISPQGSSSHTAFKEKHALPFPLLADKDKAVTEAYGLAGPFGVIRRGSFLIGPDGTIVDKMVADLRVGRHEAFARRAIQKIGGRA